MMSRKTLRTIGYVAFGFASLLVSLYLTFPAQAVGQRLSHQISKATRGQWSVRFDDISPYLLSGIEAHDVHLHHTGADGQATNITLDAARVRLELLPLLWLKPTVHAEADLGKGRLAMTVKRAAHNSYAVGMQVKDLDFANPPVFPKLADVAFGGQLAGKLKATVAAKDLTGSRGKASLTLRHASFGPTRIAGVNVPEVHLGQLDLAFDLQGGRLRLAAFEQHVDAGSPKPDVDIGSLTASLTMRRSLRLSAYDVCAQVKPNPSFLTAHGNVKAAVQLASIQFKKDSRGFLNLPIRGSLGGFPLPGHGLCRPVRQK